MRTFMSVKTNVVLASFFVLGLLASHCDCNRNINGNYQPQQPQHQHQHQQQQQQQQQPLDLDQYTSEHQGGEPFRTSASAEAPPRIGLDVNGRVKSLLWSNPQAGTESVLTPLFSSSFEDGDEEGSRQINNRISAIQPNGGFKKDMKEEKPRGLASLFLPGAVYGTADYRFRRERWYGLEKIGMIFQWNRPRSEDGDGRKDFSKLRRAWTPAKLDISVHRSLFSHSKSSGNVRIGWQHKDDGDLIGVVETNPWIQVGFEPKYSASDNGFLQTKSSERTKNPFHLRFFLPLIRRRFDLQWTSYWNSFSTSILSDEDIGTESVLGSQWSSKHRGPNEDPWWIPQVSLDPSMGTLSSNNRYRSVFSGKDSRQVLTEFKVRIRTTMPTLLSSITNTAMGTADDDDDDLQRASLLLEYSLMTDPAEQTLTSHGPSCTTARFETIIVPPFWWRSVKETARVGLIHEQNHGMNK